MDSRIIEGLKKSIYEERLAAKTYRQRAMIAKKLGYPEVVARYLEVARDEDTHEKQYTALLKKEMSK